MADGLAAILVGGRGSRMGGVAKGLLPAPGGELIVGRTTRLARAAGLDVAFVGAAAPYVAVAAELAVPILEDAAPGRGPLAGLVAALRAAAAVGQGAVVLVACDMPYVTLDGLRCLLDAAAPGAVLAPRAAAPGPEGRGARHGVAPSWEPLFARYRPALVLPAAERALAAGRLSLQALLDEVGTEAVAIDGPSLRDWDRPEDVLGPGRPSGS